jgi:hypothetical protein
LSDKIYSGEILSGEVFVWWSFCPVKFPSSDVLFDEV